MIDSILPYAVVGFFAFMAAGFGYVRWAASQENKERIVEALQDRGCTHIQVRYRWFDLDRNNTTYDVTYRDEHGKRATTACKVHLWEKDIYWLDRS